MTTSTLTPQQIAFWKAHPNFKPIQDALKREKDARHITSQQFVEKLADASRAWEEVHGKVSWKTYQSSVPATRPQEARERTFTLDEVETLVNTPAQYLDPAMTRRALEKEYSGNHLILYDALSDLKPHPGKELHLLTLDGDYRKKLSNIRRVLDAASPSVNRTKSVYYLPVNEGKKEAVYQLKQRV